MSLSWGGFDRHDDTQSLQGVFQIVKGLAPLSASHRNASSTVDPHLSKPQLSKHLDYLNAKYMTVLLEYLSSMCILLE